MGQNSGANSTMFDVVSMNMPATSRNAMISSMTTYLLLDRPSIAVASISGMRCRVSRRPNTAAPPSRNMTGADIMAASTSASLSSLKFSVRNTKKPTISV